MFVTPFIGFTCYSLREVDLVVMPKFVQSDTMMADPYGRVAKPTRGIIVVLKVPKEPHEGKRVGAHPW